MPRGIPKDGKRRRRRSRKNKTSRSWTQFNQLQTDMMNLRYFCNINGLGSAVDWVCQPRFKTMNEAIEAARAA